MQKITGNDPITKSANIVDENINRLKELFPEAFTEQKIDFDVLRQLLGDSIEEREEKFGLNWSGKRMAKQVALTPSNKTLRPCKEESVDWESTGNLYIEGDNLEVLKLLQKSYADSVKMIYIDPPYNTGNDFVYSDKFSMMDQEALKSEGFVDEDGARVKTTDVYDVNTKNSARYHTNWLNMMYPRLRLARNLLREDGVIFISIDDTEVANLRKVCDEIFGEENFIDNLIWKKMYGGKNDAKWFIHFHDYILVYAKSKELWFPNYIPRTDVQNDRYKNPDNDPRGPWKSGDFTGVGDSPSCIYKIINKNGREILPPKGKRWIVNENSYKELFNDNRVWFGTNGDGVPSIKRFLSEVKDGVSPSTIMDYTEVGHSDGANRDLKSLINGSFFDYPKPVGLLTRLAHIGTSINDIILDFFSGSATTAHAVMQLNADDNGNRKFIMVQIPEMCDEKSEAAKASYKNICEIGKERIRRAGKKIREELESKEKKDAENIQTSMALDEPDTTNKRTTPLDTGFRVFKLDTSNIKEWHTDTDDIAAQLYGHQEHLLDTRSEEDILYELMLKLNIPLTGKVEERSIAGKTVYCVGGGKLFVTLPETIKPEEVEPLSYGIIQWYKETGYIAGKNSEVSFVFRDSSFSNDVVKCNLTAIFEQAGFTNLRSL